MTLHLRAAVPGDAGLVLEFIRKLADYEHRLDEVVASEAEIDAALFGKTVRTYCDIAEWEGTPVGFAVWFYNFSTFKGRNGILSSKICSSSRIIAARASARPCCSAWRNAAARRACPGCNGGC